MNEEILNKRKIFAANLGEHAIEGINACIKKEVEKEQNIKFETSVVEMKKQIEEIITADVEMKYINQFGELTAAQQKKEKGILKGHITRVSKKVVKGVSIDISIEELREKALEEFNKNDKIRIALGNINKNEVMNIENPQSNNEEQLKTKLETEKEKRKVAKKEMKEQKKKMKKVKKQLQEQKGKTKEARKNAGSTYNIKGDVGNIDSDGAVAGNRNVTANDSKDVKGGNMSDRHDRHKSINTIIDEPILNGPDDEPVPGGGPVPGNGPDDEPVPGGGPVPGNGPDDEPVPGNDGDEPEIINEGGDHDNELGDDNDVEEERPIIDMEPNEDGEFEQVVEGDEVELNLEELKSAMEDARKTYARTHYKSEGIINRVKGFFGEGGTPVDDDVISMRDNYRQALENFRNGKLASLDGLSEAEQKEKLLELKSFDLNEKIDLYDERTAVRVEKSPSATQMTLKAIKAYKGVKTRYKIALAGALFAGGLAAGSAGAGVFGVAAMAKKVLAAGGVGIGVTSGFEAKAQNKEKKDIDKVLAISEELSMEDLKRDLESFDAESFKKDIDESFKKKIAGRNRREWYGIVAAMGITVLGNAGKLFTESEMDTNIPVEQDGASDAVTSEIVEDPHAAERDEIEEGLIAAAQESANESSEASVVEDPHAAERDEIEESLIAAAAQESANESSSVDDMFDAPYANPVEDAVVQQELAKAIAIVKPGDNLWNLIKGQLETNNQLASMSDDQRIMAIDELKDKFAAMSPDELKEIGFTSGNINKIYPGNELNLTGVMGNSETIQQALATGQNFEGDLSVGEVENLGVENEVELKNEVKSEVEQISLSVTEQMSQDSEFLKSMGVTSEQFQAIMEEPVNDILDKAHVKNPADLTNLDKRLLSLNDGENTLGIQGKTVGWVVNNIDQGLFDQTVNEAFGTSAEDVTPSAAANLENITEHGQDRFEGMDLGDVIGELNKDGALGKALTRELAEIVGSDRLILMEDMAKIEIDDYKEPTFPDEGMQKKVLSIIGRAKDVLGVEVGATVKGRTLENYLIRIFAEAAKVGKVKDIFPGSKL